MITPIELQSKTFKSGLGYDKKDVDNFINALLLDYETLYKDKMELSDKLNVLSEGLNYYKTIEKTLQKALVLAEKTAEDTKETATKHARVIEEEARTKAQLIIADANNDLEHLKRQMTQLVMQYDSYKAQFKHLAAAQCEFLESDSFQIHIPNLDNASNGNTNKGEAEEASNSTSPITEISNTKNTEDEDFEFSGLNDEEQE